jgi:hypothetical protein
MEEYESLGEIKTFNVDVHKRYKEICEARCIVLEEQDADFIFQIDFPTPPAVPGNGSITQRSATSGTAVT